ncbi:hypothetical protein AB1N83_004041 [Pleurotus pulmonarius]
MNDRGIKTAKLSHGLKRRTSELNAKNTRANKLGRTRLLTILNLSLDLLKDSRPKRPTQLLRNRAERHSERTPHLQLLQLAPL